MAIFYLRLQTIGARQGSMVAAAAYRSAEKSYRDKTGESINYTRKQGVIATGIIAPDNAPDWAYQRQLLWNRVEAAEKRKDARYGREIVLALPHELSHEKNQELVEEYIRENFTPLGMIADYALHIPSKRTEKDQDGNVIHLVDQRNIHAHILLTDRPLDGANFSKKKNRKWNDKELVEAWRENWAKSLNRKLKAEGIDHPELDHRSYARQGIDKEAQTHEGKVITSLRRQQDEFDKERFSEAVRIMQLNDLVKAHNQTLEQIEALVAANQEAEPESKTVEVVRANDYPDTALIQPLINTVGIDDKAKKDSDTDTDEETTRVEESLQIDDVLPKKKKKPQDWVKWANQQLRENGNTTNPFANDNEAYDPYDIEPEPPPELDRMQQVFTTPDRSQKPAEQNTEIEALQNAYQTQIKYRDINNRTPKTVVDEYRIKLAEITATSKPQDVVNDFRDATPRAMNYERLIRDYLRRKGFSSQQIRTAMRTASPALYKKSKEAARIYARKFDNFLRKIKREAAKKLQQQRSQKQQKKRGRKR